MNVSLRRALPAAAVALAALQVPASAQQPLQAPHFVFRSSVDLVSVTAVVRDKRGHVVSSLTRDQFEIRDAGQNRPIIDLQADATSPTSVALLMDGSGSMRMGPALEYSRVIADAVLGSLDSKRDDAALLSFDTRLVTLHDFSHDFAAIRRSLDTVTGWGSTSLYDAIAGAAGIVGERTQNRRAIVVLTDGADTVSAYTPEQVSLIASSIDVPIYVFSLAPAQPMGPNDTVTASRRNALGELAHATGGDLFVADTPKAVEAGIKRLVDDLRHQYLISFEASAFQGLRRIEVRTRRSELRVKSRGWYQGRDGE